MDVFCPAVAPGLFLAAGAGVVFVFVELQGAGGDNVVPVVGVEDGAIHCIMQGSQLQDVGFCCVGIVEVVVGIGQALFGANHQVSAEFVVLFANCFKIRISFPVFGK